MHQKVYNWLRLIVLSLITMVSSVTYAYDFEVDGLCYNIIGSDQVEVTYRAYQDRSYTGELHIPETITYNDAIYRVTSIGDYAFYGCSGLTGTLSISNSVTSIGKGAFCSCGGFTGSLTIPNSVTTIKAEAFYYCQGFNGSLTIPNSVTIIGEYAFAECRKFTGSLIIPNNIKAIKDFTFWNCSGFTGELIIPNSVTTIGYYAFNSCSGLTGSLVIPNSVESIGSRAFEGCSGLNGTLTISNSVKSILDWAFYYCSGLTSITIPNSVESISTYAFAECVGLHSITIGSGIRSIAYRAFKDCNNLTDVYCHAINVPSTDVTAFEESSINQADLHVPASSINSYKAVAPWNAFKSITSIDGSKTYNLSITAIGNGSASYGGETIKGTTKSYTVNEGSSVTITFTPDNGYRIKSLKANGAAINANTSYTATINADTSIEVEFEAIPPTTYTLSITASGNGSASYDGETFRGTTKTYTVNEGTSATIIFTPDNGYRIKSVVVNNAAVAASTSYTVTVNANTTVSVEFEAIPPTTYTLSIKATGNGSASYYGTAIRGTTKSFTVNEGTKATITFTPDDGYQIKNLKVNNTAVTASTSYTATINSDTSVEVEFEAKPVDPDIPKTYTLSIRAKGNGIATYNGETIRATTKTYTLEEGTKISMTFTPDEGNQIKSLRVNGEYQTVTDKYEGTITADTSIKIDFEEIPVDPDDPDNPDDPDTPEPPVTYTLSIKAVGNGAATYGEEVIRDNTSTFTLDEGTIGTITFTPDEDYHIKSLAVNGSAISIDTSYSFTMNSNTSVEVEFEETVVISKFSVDGLNYEVNSLEDHTVTLDAGDYGLVLDVPEKVTYNDEEWTVTGIVNDALASSEELAAVVWHLGTAFNAKVTNPNLLLYVKDEAYAPVNIKNIVVNNYASSISLTEAMSGNNFYCPQAFTAQSIEYTHNYLMKSGLNASRGWETIALPFDVQKISHSSKGEIVPFAKWTSDGSAKPFWLYELSGNGFVEADGIKANTPYIISMPNNEAYPGEYQLTGRVTFSAENVEVKKSDEVQTATYSNHTFMPSFINLGGEAGYYALNVNNDYEYYRGSENEGSKFILNLRKIHPFEAYMTSTSGTRSIDIFDSMTTGIRGIEEIVASQGAVKVYDLSGRLIKMGSSIETIRQELPTGVYIINNKKMIIK